MARLEADAAGEESTTIAEFGWKWLEAQHGSHKLAEAALASLVSGVESSWQQTADSSKTLTPTKEC